MGRESSSRVWTRYVLPTCPCRREVLQSPRLPCLTDISLDDPPPLVTPGSFPPHRACQGPSRSARLDSLAGSRSRRRFLVWSFSERNFGQSLLQSDIVARQGVQAGGPSLRTIFLLPYHTSEPSTICRDEHVYFYFFCFLLLVRIAVFGHPPPLALLPRCITSLALTARPTCSFLSWSRHQ